MDKEFKRLLEEVERSDQEVAALEDKKCKLIVEKAKEKLFALYEERSNTKLGKQGRKKGARTLLIEWVGEDEGRLLALCNELGVKVPEGAKGSGRPISAVGRAKQVVGKLDDAGAARVMSLLGVN